MKNKNRYQDFYHTILNKIKTGELKDNEKLPPERDLCDIYHISRTTVREALRNLEYDGYIERKQGSGNYVKLKPINQKLEKLYTLRSMFKSQGIKHEINIINFHIAYCDKEEVNNLKATPQDEIIRLTRIFRAAEIPYSIEYTHLPRFLFPTLTQEMVTSNGLYHTLEDLGNKPTSAVETIRITEVNDYERELLKLSKKEVAIETCRITKSDDTIIEYTRNIIKNNYFIYTVELT